MLGFQNNFQNWPSSKATTPAMVTAVPGTADFASPYKAASNVGELAWMQQWL